MAGTPVRFLLVVSYFSGIPARVTSEWVEDRLRVAEFLGIPVVLVTNPQSRLKSKPGRKVFRIPSISYLDFKFEISEMKANRGKLGMDLLWIVPWLLVSMTAGVAFDVLFRLLAGERSTGMYSWSISASVFGSALTVLRPGGRIYGTGGPSSAQVAATVIGKLSRSPVYLEFQDPFIGSEMRVSSAATRGLRILETFFVKNATQLTLVTEKAGADLRMRYPNECWKIKAEHPGSWSFDLVVPRLKEPTALKKHITLMHLGTLYGTRNLDSLFAAIDMLPVQTRDRIKVLNVGGVFLAEGRGYSNRPEFDNIDYLPRVQALEIASTSDVLLIVQHTDSRSEETIPYKTYDYINLQRPILALVNNPELERLILSNGGRVANVCNPAEISSQLEMLLRSPESGAQLGSKRPDIVATFTRLIGL